MNDEIEIVANELLAQLNYLVDEAKLDKDIFLKYGASAFHSYVAANLPDTAPNRDRDFDEAETNLDTLHQTASYLTKRCVRFISTAYGIVLHVLHTPPEHQDLLNSYRGLMEASTFMGKAIPLMEISAISHAFADENKRVEKKRYSNLQKISREVRNHPFDLLKEWALDQARSMKGSKSNIAERLATRLPSDLAMYIKDPGVTIQDEERVIGNPWRVIYDALRQGWSKNEPSPGKRAAKIKNKKLAAA